jgi:hypothetical protein
MSRYVRTTLALAVASNRGFTESNMNRTAMLSATLLDGIDHQDSGKVAHSSTYSVSFGQLSTARVVLIESDAMLEIRIDGATSGAIVRPLDGATMPGISPVIGRFYLEGEVDSIQLVNPSTTIDANFTVYLLGDP